VSVPGYDRSALVPAVVHIGVGGFHRAHQEVYLDDLARSGKTGWGLVGVGLHRPQMGEVLGAQDGLHLVAERSAEALAAAGDVGAMTRYVFAPADREALLRVLAEPRTRVVTLTITGSAYRIDPHTGELDADDEVVAADLDDPSHPETVFGYLVEALDRRRRSGAGPFTVLSCDDMQSNGRAARTAVTSFARLRDPDMAEWIAQRVSFPSSMVDRITPSTTAQTREAVVEVQLVPDVSPCETMKTRLLNASHCALGHLGHLGHLGRLAGLRTMDEVMAEPVFRAHLQRMMAEEIAPHLPDVPGIDLGEYQATLVERLADPRRGDQLARLYRRGSSKIPHHGVHGVPGEGPITERLGALAAAGSGDAAPLLAERRAFGDLGRDPRSTTAVQEALDLLGRSGPRAAIEHHLTHDGEEAA